MAIPPPRISLPRSVSDLRHETLITSYKYEPSCYYDKSYYEKIVCETCKAKVVRISSNGDIVGKPGRSRYAQPEYKCRGCIVDEAALERFGKIGKALDVEEWKQLDRIVWVNANLPPPPTGWVYTWSFTLKAVYLSSLHRETEPGKALTTFSREEATRMQ